MAKEKEDKKKTFVLSDDSLNTYGYRTLTSGIDLEQFSKNPVMLWNHTRSWSDKNNQILPIGKWENIRVENGKLLADAVFDMKDEFAVKIAKKVEAGIINMCSIGITVLEESEAPEHVVQGQTRRTITKSRLREVSIVDIGANHNAVALYDEAGNEVELSADGKCSVGLINNQEIKTMSKEESKEEKDLKNEVEELKKENKQLKADKEAKEKQEIETCVDAAIEAGKTTKDKRQHFIDLGSKIGLQGLKDTFEAIKVSAPSIIKQLKGNSSTQSMTDRSDWDWDRYQKEAPRELEKLRDNEPEIFQALYEAKYKQ